MVSLNNSDDRSSGAYAFTEDSDDEVLDSAPLMSRDPTQQTPSARTHLITGYLSLLELFILCVYTTAFVFFSVFWITDPHSHLILFDKHSTNSSEGKAGEKLLAVFCMFHSLLWLIVAITDRTVQWRHQVIRRKGYLKFYRRMKNVRRVPFVAISTGNAAILIFLSVVLYKHNSLSHKLDVFHSGLSAFYIMYAILGLEMIFALPCLVYYIVKATIFNCLHPQPDVIQETNSMANSPTATLTSVGFRDGEELDELLERQADMIRYLQQHNASLGRRIMELQARTVE